MRKMLAILTMTLAVFSVFAQDAKSGLDFAAGLGLGSEVITGADGTPQSWTSISFQPDLAFGKIGFGLNLPLHFQLYPKTDPDGNPTDEPILIYAGDWVPENKNFQGFLDLYLPKIQYVRYGLKGADPIYAKLGSFDDMTLGNGFIMGEYSNMSFQPKMKMLGLDVGVDGKAFGFPYVGLELLTGNLAQLDVVGGRLYGRPLLWLNVPIIKNLEIGASLVADSNAYLYTSSTEAEALSVFGIDAMVPVISSKLFPLAAFADMAFEPNQSFGAMLGAGGKLLGFLTYGAQIRFLQEGFVPSYFDTNYDLYRNVKYDLMQTTASGNAINPAWYASLGCNLLDSKLIFSARIDGPFAPIPATPTDNTADYPHLKAVVNLAEGILAGFYFSGSYEKYYLGKTQDFFKDVIDPTDAIVGLAINYKTGAAIITLKYNATYDPSLAVPDWVVTSSLTATMKF